MPEGTDQVARDQVAALRGDFNRHEAVCAERWTTAKNAMTRIEEGVAGLYSWRWAMAVSIIVGLIGIIGAVATVAYYIGGKIS